MKLKNLIVSILLATSNQICLPITNNNHVLAMSVSNGPKYTYMTNLFVDNCSLTIDECPDDCLTKEIIDSTIDDINEDLPITQLLIPRKLILGKSITNISLDIFGSHNLRNLNTLIVPNGSELIENIDKSNVLSNILKTKDISVETSEMKRNTTRKNHQEKSLKNLEIIIQLHLLMLDGLTTMILY